MKEGVPLQALPGGRIGKGFASPAFPNKAQHADTHEVLGKGRVGLRMLSTTRQAFACPALREVSRECGRQHALTRVARIH